MRSTHELLALIRFCVAMTMPPSCSAVLIRWAWLTPARHRHWLRINGRPTDGVHPAWVMLCVRRTRTLGRLRSNVRGDCGGCVATAGETANVPLARTVRTALPGRR
jgi:hypothetical protein